MRSNQELFEAIFKWGQIKVSEEEIAALRERSEKREYLAELCLILLDFSESKMHYNWFNGTVDELDKIQKEAFVKLEALGKHLPLAYKVAGDLYLGTMGKIVWHQDLGLPFFEKYASATGDRSILDDFDSYISKKWRDYNDIQYYQQVQKVLKSRKSDDVGYSHDPLFYENHD